jgi:hypothetical protein
VKVGFVVWPLRGGGAGTPATTGPIAGTPRPAILEGEVGDPTSGDISVRTLDWTVNTLQSAARLGSPTDRETIREVLRGELGALLHCYHLARRDLPGLTGVVHLRFAIDPAGNVRKPRAYGLTLMMASCVREVVRTTQFPKPNGAGVEVRLRMPFAASDALGRAAYPFREPYL